MWRSTLGLMVLLTTFPLLTGGCACDCLDVPSYPVVSGEVVSVDENSVVVEAIFLTQIYATDTVIEGGDIVAIQVSNGDVSKLKSGERYQFPVDVRGEVLGATFGTDGLGGSCCPQPAITELGGSRVIEPFPRSIYEALRGPGLWIVLGLVLVVPTTAAITAVRRFRGV